MLLVQLDAGVLEQAEQSVLSLVSFPLLVLYLLLNLVHHVLQQLDRLFFGVFSDLFLVGERIVKFESLRIKVLQNLFMRQDAIFILLVEHLLQSWEIALEALLDVMNAFEPVLGLQLDVVLNDHLLVSDELRDFFLDVSPARLSPFKPCFELLLPVQQRLLLLPQLFLLGHPILIQISLNQVELLVEHDIEPFLSLVDDAVELVLEKKDLSVELTDLDHLVLLNGLFDHPDLLMQAVDSIIQGDVHCISGMVDVHALEVRLVYGG